MSVDVRVFGGVDVVVGDAVVDLGHARQRCVLALLVAQANQPVSADELVDQLWGETPPPRGRDALYTYVSRLRAALAGAPDLTIAHDAGGYRITVTDTAVDLHRFRTLISQAHATTDDRVALTLLDQAMALSREEPFAGLATPGLVDLRTAVVAERYAAELDRTDLALRCGRHTGLVADLSIRVTEHPLDERLAGQFLFALYRTGRQADAIRHYQRVRATLAEKLGTRPGRTLQAVYHQILTGDEPPARPRDSVSRAPIPRQLPPAPAGFTGRESELAALSQTVVDSAIVGAGGIGKTWLILYWAYQHLDHFPDGQLFVDLHGFTPIASPVTPEDAVRGFLAGLGVRPEHIPGDLDAQTALYRRTVAGKRMLIVLDNAADSAQITPLLPDSDTCTVLITSRRHLLDLTARHTRLDVLTEPEARHLLSARLGADRVTAEAETVETLLASCGGLPLALGIVIGRALAHPDFPLSVLAAELTDHATALDALDTGDAVASLRAVLSWSTRALTTDQARVFALLGIAPGADISLSAVTALTALDTEQALAVLRELENVSLIHRHMTGRYRMHDLIRRHAADIARDDLTPGVRESALRRLIDFYVHTAHAADRLLIPNRAPIQLDPAVAGVQPQPIPDAAAALAWLDSEHTVLLAAQHTAAGHAWHTIVWQLAWALNTFHLRRGHRHDNLVAWQAARTAAEHLSESTARIQAHRLVGWALADLGRHEEGIELLRQALALAEEHHDVYAQARTHRVLALAWERRGDDRPALRHATRARDLFRALDQPVWEADALNTMGWYAARLGRYDTAYTHCRTALTLFRDLHDPDGEANTLDSLGYITHHTGHHEEAIDYYQQAIALLRASGDTTEAATTLDNLGHPYVALGAYDDARVVWQQALRLYQEQGRDADAERMRHQLDTLE